MDKRTFFFRAMAAEEYRRRAWVISAFSQTRENPDAWKTDRYPWRIVQTPTAHFFVDPEKDHDLTAIEDATPGQPPFSFRDPIDLKAGEVPNLRGDVRTTYGNTLFNFLVLVYPFGDRVEFQLGRVSAAQLEDHVLKRTIDDPDVGVKGSTPAPAPGTASKGTQAPLYTSEYVKFSNAMFQLTAFTQLCVPAVTRKTMQAAPGILALRDRLLEQNRDHLDDPAVVAGIMKELVKYDKEYLKDDEGANFLITKKSWDVVRTRLFSMMGMEAGFGDLTRADLVKTSLAEGWDISKFPSMNDTLRAGSYKRGAETALGGELVKWLLRVSANLGVTQEDCGARLGLEMTVDEDNLYKLPGSSVVTPGGRQEIDSEEAARGYLGKKIMLRSPMFCVLAKTDYCSVCAGARLSLNPTALSVAISDYGSTFMGLSLGAMHGKVLETAKMDYRKAIT
ncbi:hypothetical protein HDG34_003328 [Paraburkholderia sp. HC6.4b]|uniref:hypothetical protein n=1 Tax=unclassified Paraburkholderia TaxID=2615204 RepID=UPI001616583B|nr:MULTISPECIES: hypothetical protein [unclassified Paraburkholderia]MBB5409387.1 hypothetical protein [Paraburkholderia sp. HC6.4b]MBB5451116.1 hypothetical protein [Paraburkholderia sp. Kb1A]